MPLVSIIMGVYNCKDYSLLDKSINSIINQTFKEWELIICDDGSTNDTFEKLKQYEEIDERIRVIGYADNKGLNYALNECLKISKGKYIAREDDDDFSEPERIEKQFEFLEKNMDYTIVGTNASVINSNGVWGKFTNPEKPVKKDFLWNSPFIHPSIMMLKSAIISVEGYRISKETRRCEDYDLFMRLYAAGYKGYNIQEELYNYWMTNDPNKAYRPMPIRVDEAVVRFKGFKSLGLFWIGLPFIIKPIILGLIPSKLFSLIRKSQY